MKAGKLPLELLAQLLSKVDVSDPRVVLGPSPGEDAALIDFGDRYLVAKTDPVTFATDLIGSYVVQVNANDIAVMGATPRWLMATLLLPEGTSEDRASAMFDQMREACDDLGISLIGGHTEVTYDLSRPIAVGAMLGEVAKDRVVLTSGARPGDVIVVTKGIAIEGASILARDSEDDLLRAGVDERLVQTAKEYLFSPGISVVKDATVVHAAVEVHSMHDPTEGGLATALVEVATAASVGLIVDEARIPVTDECRSICRALGLDPLGLIASGALLATLRPEVAPKLIAALAAEGIPAYEIGRITPAKDGLKLRSMEGVRDLPTFERDELARYLSA